MPGTVVIVDVGQGDCTIAVDAETREALLVDCNEGHHNAAVQALEELKFSELRAAVVTHSHMDHVGGVLDVLEQLDDRFTGALYLNHDTLVAMPRFTDESDDNKTKVRAMLGRVYEYAGRVSRAQSDIGPQSLGTMRWAMLAPSYGQLVTAVAKGRPNLGSGIVLIESEGQQVVVGGDAQLETWQALEDPPNRPVVRWPHHGGHVSTSPDAHRLLLDLLDPTAVLVSVGAGNPYGHPADDFFLAVADHGSRLLCTQATSKCTAGAAGRACAGSIRIDLLSGGEPQVTPSQLNHDTFIRSLGTAQCLVSEHANGAAEAS